MSYCYSVVEALQSWIASCNLKNTTFFRGSACNAKLNFFKNQYFFRNILELSSLEGLAMLSSVNKFLLLLRFILSCLPLPGYIHPDEFFQSPEVAADDVLGFNTTRTWEWDSSSPARSVVFPMLSSGLPFVLIRLINTLFGMSYTTYILLVLPRLWMTILTYLIDLAMEKIAQKIYHDDSLKERKEKCIFLFRSSAVTLVFFTRTFSNTFETMLLALFLLKIVSQANQDSFTKHLSSTTATTAFILTIAFFIRPTFVCFALVGSLVYFAMCIKNGNVLSQAIVGIGVAAITSFAAICLDSYYFSTIEGFQVSITPLNLIKYNLNESNLLLHGLHPRFLHLAVNCPMMFGPLFGVFILSTAELVLLSYNASKGRKWEVNLIFLASSTWLAIFILSYFRHQEPRYISPVIFAMSLVVAWALDRRPMLWKRFIQFWVIFNAALVAWFGFVHQGGITPCLSHLNKEINLGEKIPNIEPCTKYNILFWYTYMAPEHLISAKKDADNKQIMLHNLGSLPAHNVTEMIEAIKCDEGHTSMKCYQKVS